LSCEADAVVGQKQTMRFARAVGFDDRAAWEVAIASSELATNAIKYGGKGRLVLRRIDAPRRGIEVTVEDRGPGFADPERAGRDERPPAPAAARSGGRRGLGLGLGVVRRMMDDVLVENRTDGGARVTARKWVPEANR